MPKVTPEMRSRIWFYLCQLKVELQGSLSHSSDTLDVRLGFSLCQEEEEFVQKRKVVVAKALSQVLQLEEGLHEDEVGKQGSNPGLRVTLGSWSPIPCSTSHSILPNSRVTTIPPGFLCLLQLLRSRWPGQGPWRI